jgi:hypothetical protein
VVGIAQMKNNRTVTYLLLISFAATLSSCAAFDRWLLGISEEPAEEPAIIFKSNICKDKTDTLVILALLRINVMTKGPSQRELKFYLENMNKSIAVSNMTNQQRSKFLHFTKIKGERLNKLQEDFPQIQGMQVFGIYLKELTIDKEKLKNYKILQDAKYQDIHFLNERIINKRKTIFVVHKPSKNQITNHLHMVKNTYVSDNVGADSVPSSADASQSCQVSQTG